MQSFKSSERNCYRAPVTNVLLTLSLNLHFVTCIRQTMTLRRARMHRPMVSHTQISL